MEVKVVKNETVEVADNNQNVKFSVKKLQSTVNIYPKSGNYSSFFVTNNWQNA